MLIYTYFHYSLLSPVLNFLHTDWISYFLTKNDVYDYNLLDSLLFLFFFWIQPKAKDKVQLRNKVVPVLLFSCIVLIIMIYLYHSHRPHVFLVIRCFSLSLFRKRKSCIVFEIVYPERIPDPRPHFSVFFHLWIT